MSSSVTKPVPILWSIRKWLKRWQPETGACCAPWSRAYFTAFASPQANPNSQVLHDIRSTDGELCTASFCWRCAQTLVLVCPTSSSKPFNVPTPVKEECTVRCCSSVVKGLLFQMPTTCLFVLLETTYICTLCKPCHGGSLVVWKDPEDYTWKKSLSVRQYTLGLSSENTQYSKGGRGTPGSTAPLPADYRCDMGMKHNPGGPILERLNLHLPTSAFFQHPCGLGPFQKVFLRCYLASVLGAKRVHRKQTHCNSDSCVIFDPGSLPQPS